MKRISAVAVATAALLGSGIAEATLHDRGGGLIYDDVLDVTWLQDANYAKTSGYDSDGAMDWATAMAWANQLTFGGVGDWRLPSVEPIGTAWNMIWTNNGSSDYGGGIVSPHSEMSYMWYVNLGNKGQCLPDDLDPGSCVVQPGWGLADDPTNPQDENLFLNIQPYLYWSSTAQFQNPDAWAWVFLESHGFQSYSVKTGNEFFAWAVHDGDVAAVPEPETYVMLLAGLGVISAFARRKARARS